MANAVLLDSSRLALDPDHVVYLDQGNLKAHLSNGEALKLNKQDFAALYAVKTGVTNG